jgi:hypothetical protein
MLRDRLIKYCSAISAVLFLFSGCDDLLTTPPLDKITDDAWWADKSQVEMMVDNCYTYLWGEYEVTMHDCMTDNAKHRSDDIVSVGNGTFDTQNSFVSSQWRYNVIARLNYVLEGIEKSRENLSDNEYRQFRAQIRFIRAFNYYHMLFHFGDIPLITHTLTVAESRETSRQPRAEVLAFVLKELEESLADIETVPVTESGRVNRDVVNAYLCRVNLYEKNYDRAVQHADAVIQTGKYELYYSYEDLFRPQTDGQTKEIIFERQYSRPLYVNEVNLMLSSSSSVYSGWTRVLPLQDFVDEYECIEGHPYHDCESLGCEYVQKRKEVETDTRRGEYEFRDPRLAVSIQYPFWEWKVDGVVKSVYGVDDPTSRDYTQSATHTTGYLVIKWVDLRGVNAERDRAEKNMTILRYGDLLLMKAEALIETNQDLSEAAGLINEVRARAGMPPVDTGTQDEMRRALRHERRIETAFEGLRYFDIIRWRIAEQVKPGKAYGARMKAISENMDHKFMEDRFWDNKMYLFPIPQSARDVNPNLTQNPGW